MTGAPSGGLQATSFDVRTSLSAAQEVPAPIGDVNAASGTFTGTIVREDSGAAISWELSFSGLTGDAIAAHIHRGATGRAGPVATFLCGPCVSPISGTARVDTAAISAIQGGTAYVNVHTSRNATGEIRGQLEITAGIATPLTSRQGVPKPTGNVRRAKGSFTATVTKRGTTGTMTWRLRFSGLTGKAVAAHVHVASRGKTGPVVVSLCSPCRTNARGTANLTTATLRALETGRAYVNVHTAKNAKGEIRGQIRAAPLSLSG